MITRLDSSHKRVIYPFINRILKLIANPPKIGTKLLIKFGWKNSKRYLELSRDPGSDFDEPLS